MNKRELFKKTIAWTLITAMANPAAMAPAFARDTDIFLNVTTGITTAEPNILIALGTNDRMNIAEPWREYPGAYDSHVEYLWNDINIINNGAEQTTESASKISTGAQPTNPFSVYGFWAGGPSGPATTLWNAARAYALATEPGDPGPRYTWRNYNDASWYYWLPAGTAETDARLRSPLFNRFRGHQNTLNGTRGGVSFTGTTNYQSKNACAASIAQLVPSTVFYPSAVPRNAGKYLNDQWFRWENWRALDAVNVANYPGDDNVSNSYVRGYLDSSIAPPADWNSIPATRPLRDNTGGTGAASQGQPIRLRNVGVSGANWTDPAADLGGYEFQSYVNALTGVNLSGTNIQNVLTSIRGVYGYTQLTPAGTSGQEKEQFSAWRGNRDNLPAAPAFGLMTGTAGYFDVTSSPTSNCVPASGGTTATCLPVAGGTPGTVTKTRTCTYVAGSFERDAGSTDRKWGGSCTGSAGNVCGVDITCSDSNGAGTFPDLSDVANPGLCNATTAKLNTFINVNYLSCGWAPARASVNIATCQWSGRQSTFIEGQGWYYYGGSCQENGSTASCTMGGSTVTFGGTAYYNVTGPHANPGPDATYLSTTGCSNTGGFAAGNYYHGPTADCKGNNIDVGTSVRPGNGIPLPGATGPAASNCTVSGLTGSKTIRGTVYNNVGTSAGAGCSDKTDLNLTCSARTGIGVQCDNPSTPSACPNVQTTFTGSGTSQWYLVANRSSTLDNMVYDCLGDDSPGNHMYSNPTRAFGTGWNVTVSDGVSTPTASYTNGVGLEVPADPNKKIDVYAVNYLNWKFGPKSNGNPIGRKTRLQIAQDALSSLVQATNGVRFGLMVHNRTAGCSSTTGTILAGSNLFTQDVPPGWLVSSNISVAGVGAGGATLNTSITAINGNTLTLAASALIPSTTGGIVIGTPTLTVASAAGFTADSPIRVVGAGAAGADLVTTITSVVGSDLTLATNAGATQVATPVKRAATNPRTTGTMTAGSPLLTVADATGLVVGQQVTVTGAGASSTDLYSEITSIAAAPVITLADNAGTTITDSPITTGSITAGSPTLTVASAAGLVVGQQVTVTGAGAGGTDLNSQIASIAGLVITLADNAGTTVAGAAVRRPAATPVAIASFTTTMQSNPCSAAFTNEGANIAYKITRMGSDLADPDYANRGAMINAINNVVASSRTPLTETLYEAYRYYSGRTPRFGTLSTTAFVGGSVTAGRDTTAVCAAAGVGCPASGVYRSPMLNNPNTTSPAACQKNFVILITNGQPEDDWSTNAEIKSMSYAGLLGPVSPKTNVDQAQPDTATFQLQTGADPAPPYGPVDFASTAYDGGYIWLDELTYFMSRADVSPGARNFAADAGTDLIDGRQSVITYTIGFAGVDSPVVANAALASGGTYYLAQDSGALSAALTDAIVSIVNWNPTIAAPSVPISALNRTENATDIYLSFFQPDPSQAWKGTLKKYALGTTEALCGDGMQLCLTGQTVLANPITCGTQTATCKNIEKVEVDPVTSAINVVVHEDTVSFWNPLGVIDGSQPAQGGSGYQLLNTGGYNPSTRNVYTFLTNGVSSSTALTNATNRVRDTNALINTATVITGTGSDAERSKLINFLLGGDPGVGACADASGAATACTTWRSWAHSDVQHSKPVIVTYDATTGPPVQYVFYTSNDGLLHAVDTNTGQEKWAFLIEEAYSKLTAMFNDNAGPSLDVADGQISVWTYDNLGDGKIETAADKAYLFFGLRRGGSAYYALDVSSRDAPVFKWKIAGGGSGAGKVCVGNSACTVVANYDELGQTWSAATVGKVRAPGGVGTVALIFGGGFDPAEDTIPRGPRTMGRGVFVVDSETGDVINSWGVGQAGAYRAGSGTMAYAIPSDVTALNTDIDAQGFIDRLYVGDMGGNVWRMDVNNPTATAWRAKQLASLSEATGESRKFMFAPAAVKQNSPERFDAVYIGSGDREHPLTTSTSLPANANRDKMFMIKDDYQLEATAGAPFALGNLLDRAEGDTSQLTDADIANPVKGWIVGLQDGEKVINAPTVFFNKLRFGTYAPLAQANACAPPGASRLNEIDALTGNFFDLNVGDGLTSTDRWYGSTSTGYISTGQIIVLGKNIYHIVASPLLQYQLIGTIGAGTKIYWYMEPEQ